MRRRGPAGAATAATLHCHVGADSVATCVASGVPGGVVRFDPVVIDEPSGRSCLLSGSVIGVAGGAVTGWYRLSRTGSAVLLTIDGGITGVGSITPGCHGSQRTMVVTLAGA